MTDRKKTLQEEIDEVNRAWAQFTAELIAWFLATWLGRSVEKMLDEAERKLEEMSGD
jgi:ATP-dependent Clp protease ATP-binding subunit ClpA